MPSPFPGMDPYLEQPGNFEMLHGMLPTFVVGALNRQIRPKYFAQLGTQVYIDATRSGERELVVPDAFVAKQNGARTAALAEKRRKPPALVRLPNVGLRKQKYVQIVDKSEQRVVTAIEILSPANKSGRGFDEYDIKRQEYRGARINLVEIDLLRRGRRPLTEDPLPAGDYFVLVCRAYSDRAEVWPIRLRERLPRFPVPLDSEDPDATLDLQSLFEKVYEEAGWDEEIYHGRLTPPLRGPDAAWAKKLVEARHS